MAGLRNLINNFSTTLNESISNSDTSFDLVDATGISTALTTLDYVPLTIDDGTNIEIIHVTGVSTNTITCTRGMEGTSGTAFALGDIVQCRPTAASILESSEWIPIEKRVLGSAATTVDFDVPDGTYKLVFENVTMGGVSDPDMTMRVSYSASFFSTNYSQAIITSDSSAVTASAGIDTTAFTGFDAVSSTSTHRISGEVIIHDTGTSSNHNVSWNFYQGDKRVTGSGWYTGSSGTIDQFRILGSLSNSIASGSVFMLYKRNK